MLVSLEARAAGEAIEPTQCRIQGTNSGVLTLLIWGECASFVPGEQVFEALLQVLAGSQHQCGVFDVNGNRPLREVVHPGVCVWSNELL
jgi:hypothetical protein